MHRYDVANLADLGHVPISSSEPVYDLNAPELLYYVADETFELHAVSPTVADHLVFDFEAAAVAEVSGSRIYLAAVPTSADQRLWAFVVGGSSTPGGAQGAIVWYSATGDVRTIDTPDFFSAGSRRADVTSSCTTTAARSRAGTLTSVKYSSVQVLLAVLADRAHRMP